MEQYKFLDVRFTYHCLKPAMDAAWAEVNDSGIYIGGAAVDAFEAAFAAYCESEHCVGTGNGLDALSLTLRAFHIGPGDEVIVPAHTFIATWLAVSGLGATLVPVDADPVTMNMNIEAVARAITPRTKAIIPVHLYGAPVPCDRLREIADQNGICLLEDAAQAHGAIDHGRRAGSLGHAGAFSFYPGKNLGAFGDGGAVVTNDAELAHRIRRLCNYGMLRKYQHEIAGVNSRLDTLQARILTAKLEHIDAWNGRRQAIAEIYSHALARTPGLVLPQPDTQSSWHLYVIRHVKRDALRARLADLGVETGLHYPVPNHHSGAYRAEFGGRSFPVTEEICRTCLSLPIGPHLSLADAVEIAGIVHRAVAAL